MIVRCGRCQVELEVAGAGEFLCPACGTRNMVRGAAGAPAASPFGLPDLGGPLPPATGTAPGATIDEPPSDVRWVHCPTCAYRFALGEVQEVQCPACSASLKVDEEGSVALSE